MLKWRLPCSCALLLIASLAAPLAEAQSCDSSRALSAKPFGFVKAAGQGANDSYVYLVFIMDVSSAGASQLECSAIMTNNRSALVGMQKAEAAIWAVDTFRSRFASLLPGVTVGALVLDTCESSALPVQLLSNLQACETNFGAVGSLVEPRSTAGFVGIETAAAATDVQPVLTSIGKAAISYGLTSSVHDTSSFPILARLSPSDAEEAEAMAALIQSLGSKHAQVVYSSSATRRYSAMADALQRRLAAVGICVANKIQFSGVAAASVNSFATVRPVALLLTSSDVGSFAAQMAAIRPASGAFTWLLATEHSHSVADFTAGRENFFAGSLVLQQEANSTGYADFQDYFKALQPGLAGHSAKNPWLSSFWAPFFRCNLPGSSSTTYSSTCNYANPAQNLQTTTSFDPSAARVIQAVDLLLYALDQTRRNLCGNATGLCTAFLNDSGRDLAIRASVYNGSFSLSGLPGLDSSGGPRNYSLRVRNYQKTYPGHAWQAVGSYDSGVLSLTASPQAYGVDERNTSWVTECDAACEAVCSPNMSTTAQLRSTTPMISSTSTGINFPGSLRRKNWVYSLIVCACVGIAVTLIFLVYIVAKVSGLPTERKSFNSLWSGQVLLVIILIGYISLFVWVPWPTVESCGIVRFMVGFVYAAMFSILLVKLLNLMNEFLPPVYQVLLFFLALAVQVATAVEWLILRPSRVDISDSGSQCNHEFLDHLQTLVYCMLLILICTALAVRAHSIGKNNREAIFIGSTAGISIPIWVAWTLVGSLSTGQDFKDASMAFGLFVNLTLTLLVIFLPKIYQLRLLKTEANGYNNDYDNGDPIYVLTQGAPSVKSEGTIYVSKAPILAFPDLQNGAQLFQQPRTQSLMGDLPRGAGTMRSVQPSPHKAYSDYNYRQEEERPRTRARSAKRDASLPKSAGGADTRTKAEKLAQLGFL